MGTLRSFLVSKYRVRFSFEVGTVNKGFHRCSACLIMCDSWECYCSVSIFGGGEKPGSDIGHRIYSKCQSIML